MLIPSISAALEEKRISKRKSSIVVRKVKFPHYSKFLLTDNKKKISITKQISISNENLHRDSRKQNFDIIVIFSTLIIKKQCCDMLPASWSKNKISSFNIFFNF